MSGKASNALGERGEAIFKAVMTKFHGALPLFRVQFLGDKWPTVDFICELEGDWKRSRPFCLVQVKTTRLGYTKRENRLRVAIKASDVDQLRRFKVPTYVVGIDEHDERVFIVATAGKKLVALSSIHSSHELTGVSGRKALWTEVREFWRGAARRRNWSGLTEPKWK